MRLKEKKNDFLELWKWYNAHDTANKMVKFTIGA